MGWGIALGVIALLVTLFMICPIGFSVGSPVGLISLKTVASAVCRSQEN